MGIQEFLLGLHPWNCSISRYSRGIKPGNATLPDVERRSPVQVIPNLKMLINVMITWLIPHSKSKILKRNYSPSLTWVICKILDASPTRLPPRLPSGVRSDEVVVVCSRLISMSRPKRFLIVQCNCQNKRFGKLCDVDNSPIKFPCAQGIKISQTKTLTTLSFPWYFFFKTCLPVSWWVCNCP